MMWIRAALVSAVSLALTPAVFAGFIATTGTDPVSTPAGSLSGPQVGDVFQTSSSGTLTSYTPFTSSDPQLTGADLSHYRYDLSGEVTSVNLSLGYVTYAGNYDIYYDLNSNGVKDTTAPTDPVVSAGTFTILAQFIAGTNNANLTGTLIQQSDAGAPFADLSYGGNPVVYQGFYTGTNPGVSGTIQGELIQAAAFPTGGSPTTPEPASIGLLALGGMALLARRRAAK